MKELIEKLEYHLTPDSNGWHKADSIMNSGVICHHDDAFMCECRAAKVIEWVKEKTDFRIRE